MSASPHRIVDRWRDCVVVCACGWRTARASYKAAVREWGEHRRGDAAQAAEHWDGTLLTGESGAPLREAETGP